MKPRNGSTRYWRKLRELVAARDGYRCRIGLPGVCRVTAPLSGLDAGHLHHVQGRATGNDPRYLVWSCAPCNMKTGDPRKAPDPPPMPRTRW